MYSQNSTSYSRSFTVSIVLITPLVAAVMLVISSSIVRAFTLLGALALIRFRSAIKEPEDMAVIFWSVVTGIAIGSKLYGFAGLIIITIGLLLFVIKKTKFGVKNSKITVSVTCQESQIEHLGKKMEFEIISSERKKDLEYTYTITLRKNNNFIKHLKDAKITTYTIFESTHY